MAMHKVQRATVYPPDTMTTCFRDVFEASMACTAISRVRAAQQLCLLIELYENNIYTSLKTLKALNYIENREMPIALGEEITK